MLSLPQVNSYRWTGLDTSGLCLLLLSFCSLSSLHWPSSSMAAPSSTWSGSVSFILLLVASSLCSLRSPSYPLVKSTSVPSMVLSAPVKVFYSPSFLVVNSCFLFDFLLVFFLLVEFTWLFRNHLVSPSESRFSSNPIVFLEESASLPCSLLSCPRNGPMSNWINQKTWVFLFFFWSTLFLFDSIETGSQQ